MSQLASSHVYRNRKPGTITGVIPRRTLKISASAMSRAPANRPIARTLSAILVAITRKNQPTTFTSLRKSSLVPSFIHEVALSLTISLAQLRRGSDELTLIRDSLPPRRFYESVGACPQRPWRMSRSSSPTDGNSTSRYLKYLFAFWRL